MTYFKAFILFVLILAVSILHIHTVPSEYGIHILHRELFFIPIILASFWFGLRSGIIVAILVCIIYAPLIMTHGGQHYVSNPVIFAQLIMYLLVAALIGWLRDRQLKQHKELLASERATALAKAAAALSFEIKDVVKGLNEAKGGDFQAELSRLNHLVEILSRYMPVEEEKALSTDLNTILESSYNRKKQNAKKQGIELTLEKDPAGCPTMIVSESLERILDSLIDNALEASKRGQKISLRSQRGGLTCQLEVSDEGRGVAEKNRKNLFSPFFTTKPNGNGLALAAGRKVLREHCGDLVYKPGSPSGAIFQMIVPRENEDSNIDEFARTKHLRG